MHPDLEKIAALLEQINARNGGMMAQQDVTQVAGGRPPPAPIEATSEMRDLYRFATSMIEQGEDEAEINDFLLTQLGMDQMAAAAPEGAQPPNALFALRMAIESADERQESESLIQSEIARNPEAAAVQSLGYGMTIGGANELLEAIGKIPGLEAVGRAGRRAGLAAEERAKYAPVADMLSQLLGGALIPAIGLEKVAATAPKAGVLGHAARGGRTGARVGAASGAVGGALTDEENRVRGAMGGFLAGGTMGAALGTIFGVPIGVVGSNKGRGSRVAQMLSDVSSLPQVTRGESGLVRRNPVLDVLKETKEGVSTVYQQIGQEHPVVDDLGVFQALYDIEQQPLINRRVPEDFHITNPNRRAPSFEELQQIERNLRADAWSRRNSATPQPVDANIIEGHADELRAAMEDVIGEDLVVANRAWAQASDLERTLQSGWDDGMDNLWEPIERKLEGLGRAQREAYDTGRVARVVGELKSGNVATIKKLTRMIEDEASDTRRIFASMFEGGTDGPQFQRIERILRSEASDANKARLINHVVSSAAIAVAGGTIGGMVAGRGGGGGRS